jgi:hypothetical protein
MSPEGFRGSGATSGWKWRRLVDLSGRLRTLEAEAFGRPPEQECQLRACTRGLYFVPVPEGEKSQLRVSVSTMG